MTKISRKEWRNRAQIWQDQYATVESELQAARAWANDAENRAGAAESEVLRMTTQFRNILNALGRSNAPSSAQVTRARGICRDELPMPAARTPRSPVSAAQLEQTPGARLTSG